MTLTLTISNAPGRLDNGSPGVFVVDRRDAVIGRSPSCDWVLPDPRHVISSRHCQVTYRDGGYALADVSTNGTLLNGASDRMAAPRRIENGDRFQVGLYEIVATVAGGLGVVSAGGGWATPGPAPTSSWDAPSPASSWDLPPRSRSASSGWDMPPPSPVLPEPVAAPRPASNGWDRPPSAAPAPWPDAPAGPSPAWPESSDPVSSFGASPEAAVKAAPAPVDDWLAGPSPDARSPWDDPAPVAPDAPWPAPAPAPAAHDVWGRIDDGNAIDWGRGGFDEMASNAAPPPAPDTVASPPWPAPDPAPPAPWSGATTLPPAAAPPSAPDPAPVVAAFAAAAGLAPTQLKNPGIDTIERAGALLKQLVAGLVVMVEARARAKSQMGAEATSLSFDGNSPIKFARTPEQALAQLLNSKERGFMDAAPAIEDAFWDLQSHQMATLKAMQGALRATLDRFSPTSIKARAESKGLMARIMPGAREAALWQAYEREFGGVARGSDEAFMDVFAKEFRKAYEDQEKGRRR